MKIFQKGTSHNILVAHEDLSCVYLYALEVYLIDYLSLIISLAFLTKKIYLHYL